MKKRDGDTDVPEIRDAWALKLAAGAAVVGGGVVLENKFHSQAANPAANTVKAEPDNAKLNPLDRATLRQLAEKPETTVDDVLEWVKKMEEQQRLQAAKGEAPKLQR